MLISIRLEPALKERVDTLVRRGHYPDFNAAAVVALENLWTMEEEHQQGGETIPSKSDAAHGDEIPPEPLPGKKAPIVSAKTDLVSPGRAEVVGWRHVDVPREHIQPPPGDRFSQEEAIPLERWVFGQQNRILPLKANARLLASMCAAGEEDLTLARMADRVSEGAANVREYLERLDSQFTHKKDDLLATAFPAANSDKSRQRYATHFVASESSNGELSGLMLDWKLASAMRKKGKAYLYPTAVGIEWANILNPLFDTTVSREPIKFSTEELEWALTHVKRNVPVESYAFSTVLNAIASGANDPTKLDAYLRESGKVSDPRTSPEFVATQRTGALSRMADLDLIRRIRNGVRVTYAVSSRGEQWVHSFNKK